VEAAVEAAAVEADNEIRPNHPPALPLHCLHRVEYAGRTTTSAGKLVSTEI